MVVRTGTVVEPQALSRLLSLIPGVLPDAAGVLIQSISPLCVEQEMILSTEARARLGDVNTSRVAKYGCALG